MSNQNPNDYPPPRVIASIDITSQQVQPDAEQCSVCGDPCFLTQVQLAARMNGDSSVFAIVCGACSEMVEALKAIDLDELEERLDRDEGFFCES